MTPGSATAPPSAARSTSRSCTPSAAPSLSSIQLTSNQEEGTKGEKTVQICADTATAPPTKFGTKTRGPSLFSRRIWPFNRRPTSCPSPSLTNHVVFADAGRAEKSVKDVVPSGGEFTPSSLTSSSVSVSDLERGAGAETDPAGAELHRTITATSTSCTIPVSPPPDGGPVAWLQAFLCWLTIMNTWGFINSFGVFQIHYSTVLLPQYSNSVISWIGSLQAFGVFFWGIFSGRAFDLGYFKSAYRIGLAFSVSGLFLLSWSQTLWQVFLTHGFLNGVGCGFLFTPALSLTATYFAKNRALALGIATTGNAVGGLVYPLVVRELLDVIGFGWTIRVLAFINLFCFGMGAIFFRPRKLRPLGNMPLLDFSALTDVPFMCYTAGLCLIAASSYFVYYYVASYGRDILGMSFKDSLNLIMLVNGIGVPARILPGFLADRFFGPLNTYIPCVAFATIVTFGWFGVTTVPGLYVWTAFYGCGVSAYQSMYGTVISTLTPRPEQTGTRMGLVSFISAFTSTAGAPIGGAILAAGGYTPAIAYTSVVGAVGFAFVIAMRTTKVGWKNCRC